MLPRGRADAEFPTLQIAVLRETEAAGPYCSLVMAVVVVKDVLVFVMFATNLEVASVVSPCDLKLTRLAYKRLPWFVCTFEDQPQTAFFWVDCCPIL